MVKTIKIVFTYDTPDVSTTFTSSTRDPGNIIVLTFKGDDSCGNKYLINLNQYGTRLIGETTNRQAANFLIAKSKNPDKLISNVSFSVKSDATTGKFSNGTYESADGSKLIVGDNDRTLVLKI